MSSDEKTTHTPGPWVIREIPNADKRNYRNNQLVEIVAASDESDEIVSMPDWSEEFSAEMQANARLISAAPELLSACKGLVEISIRITPNACHPSKRFCAVCGRNSEAEVHSNGCPVKQAEDAIAKANGGVA